MKSVIKWSLRIIGIFFLLLIIAGIAVYFIVDKDLVAGQMEKALNRHVTIKDIDVGIFSVISGIEVNKVRISNYKTAKQLKKLQGKPVPRRDLFVGLKSFKFKVQLLPLLQKKFVLKELVLYEPVVNVVKNKKGYFNFNDLIAPKPLTPAEKAELEKVKQEDAAKEQPPLKADDIPVAISIGKVGMEKGTINYNDRQFRKRIRIYKLNALVKNIEIDPENLKSANNMNIDVNMGIKTLGKLNKGAMKSFDVGIKATGNAIPFDKKTRIMNPEVSLKVGSSYGRLTGLKIYDKLKAIKQIAKYSGKFAFLKKNLKWKNAYVNVWYKAGIVKLTNGKISTDDYESNFAGTHNVNNKKIALDVDMIVDKKHNSSVEKGIDKNIKKVLKGKAARYIKPEDVRKRAMKPLLNKDGNIYLKYAVTGTTTNPDTELVAPELPTIKELVKGGGKSVKSAAKKAAKKKASKAKKKASKKAKKKASKAKKKLKKKFKL